MFTVVAIIKGDIISSRKIENQDAWLKPLKELFSRWGKTPKNWEIIWGDEFQLEIEDPMEALQAAIEIKSLVKKIELKDSNKKSSIIDVRMSIGIGEKTYSSNRISESNGSAFVFASEIFNSLKKEKVNMAVKTQWPAFDEEINLYLKLAGLFMDNWSISSAELIETVIQNSGITQKEIGRILKIKQNSVSGRWNRAKASEVLEIESVFRRKLNGLL